MPHLPASPEAVAALRSPTERHPWRVLVSGCMTGQACSWVGDDNGQGKHTILQALLGDLRVVAVPFCPEHLAMGTPRGIPDIHGGDGFDVLAGRATVLVDGERDVTAPLLAHATAMATLGETCDFAILVDISGTCGSQVISLGNRRAQPRTYQAGPALVAALLWRRHIPFTSHRDHRTLDRLLARLTGNEPSVGGIDHHEQPWVRENLPHAPWSRSERALAERPTVSERSPIYKILTREQWEAREQVVPWAPIDEQDGFLHLSTADQLEQTLTLHFAGASDLMIVQLDAARIPTLIWETSRGGALFPHAYGPVPLSAVVQVETR